MAKKMKYNTAARRTGGLAIIAKIHNRELMRICTLFKIISFEMIITQEKLIPVL